MEVTTKEKEEVTISTKDSTKTTPTPMLEVGHLPDLTDLQPQTGPIDSPGARLQTFAGEWAEAPDALARIVRRGFHWTWLTKPPPLSSKIPSGGRSGPELDLAVEELLRKNAIY